MFTRFSLILLLASLCHSLSADEGMWPFNLVPKEQIKKKYGLTLSEEWLKKVQRSCLRMSTGGSASFISRRGLVMTNHHVGAEALYDLSGAENNLFEKGFYAETEEEEIRAPGLYVDQLVQIEDVTAAVRAAMAAAPENREKARKETLAKLASRAKERTGLEPEVVTLYQGGRYQIYLYKRYTDVRLVMAPEKQIAFLGGDAENFCYPRYDLDVCFFRVYEGGRPLDTPDYFSWSDKGPEGEELLFVVGHPGNTRRLYTSAHLVFLRECSLPLALRMLDERICALEAFSGESSEKARMAEQDLFHFLNARKVYRALLQGLQGPHIMKEKQAFEKKLFQEISWQQKEPWCDLEVTLQKTKTFYPTYFALEGAGAHGFCTLFDFATYLVRARTEKEKPSETRLKEYTESELHRLEIKLFSSSPLYHELEALALRDVLCRMQRALGADSPLFQGQSPQGLANTLLATKLFDVAYREELYNHPALIDESTDPLILFAKALDPKARELRQKYEEIYEAHEKEDYKEISEILFAKYGTSLYPDATFTLRLSFGQMKGYKQDKCTVPPFTLFEGAFCQAAEHPLAKDYQLPASWLDKKADLPLSTPFNFVSTHDIIGGNSGSPVLNSQREIVGLIFDGNQQSLTWNLLFDECQGRAISVHSKAILTALTSVYKADKLVQEINQNREK